MVVEKELLNEIFEYFSIDKDKFKIDLREDSLRENYDLGNNHLCFRMENKREMVVKFNGIARNQKNW